ncbi:MAG: mannose-1-phosphate guanylyltransferase [Bacteriovoracaceae bacterium]|nr:mannose-1-phosphate guanylyltransferase [Bacteriovoracaceae bacterium]
MSEMVESQLYAVVMAGGKGTRFWPESTRKRPKQYLNLTGGDSLLGKTLQRFEGLVAAKQRYVVTVKEQESLAKECGDKKMASDGLIFEPSGRNTAPCILLSLAALEAKGVKGNDVIAIVPSDHVILNESGFRDTVKKAAETALKEKAIVTIGIKPNFPHTGYGYIHRALEVSEDIFSVSEFREKPDRSTAENYLATGEYFWNAGMFVASLNTLKEEFSTCSPETYKHYEDLKSALTDDSKLAQVYGRLPEDSIDYAIMEKSKKVMVVAADFDWNDLGSWDALESVVDPTEGNTLVENRAQFIKDATGNIVYAPGKHVSLIGVKDLIIVSNKQSLVILPKERSQEIKEVVKSLQENNDLADLL